MVGYENKSIFLPYLMYNLVNEESDKDERFESGMANTNMDVGWRWFITQCNFSIDDQFLH